MDNARNSLNLHQNITNTNKAKVNLSADDKLALGVINYAQGLGASLRFANELRAVQQTGRLPCLRSSKLHEDVLRGNLGPGNGFRDMFGQQEETGPHNNLI